MDAFQQELAQAMSAAQRNQVPEPGEDPFDFQRRTAAAAGMTREGAGEGAGGPGSMGKPPGLEKFSHEQIMGFYKQIAAGEVPEELKQMSAGLQANQYTDADGNPIIDEEGGAVIQPLSGYVVKTKDIKTQGKVFVNMTCHDLVEGFEEKPIPQEDAEKAGASEVGLRIPLSLGTVREENDKKGDPVQVYDFIWNTGTVKQAQKNAGFRQIMVELAFNYIKQKFDIDLDLRFTIPKMKYKGDTIQYQRIKVKKAPKIQEMKMTEEEKRVLEERAMAEERRREALREKEPKWNLYCIMNSRLNQDFGKEEYISSIIKDQFETECVGDDSDRWTQLVESFALREQLDVFEEYDGLNSEDADGLLMVVSLPLLTRGHAIQCHVLSEGYLQVQVPNLYHCHLALPFKTETSEVSSYFDCKIRRLFVHITKKAKEEVEIAPASEEVQESSLVDDVIEDDDDIEVIDTDDHFGREKTGKVQAADAPRKEPAVVNSNDLEDDLLYDLC